MMIPNIWKNKIHIWKNKIHVPNHRIQYIVYTIHEAGIDTRWCRGAPVRTRDKLVNIGRYTELLFMGGYEPSYSW